MIETLPSPPEFPLRHQPLPTPALILKVTQWAVGRSHGATVEGGSRDAEERPLTAECALKCQRRPEGWSWGSGGLLIGPRLFLEAGSGSWNWKVHSCLLRKILPMEAQRCPLLEPVMVQGVQKARAPSIFKKAGSGSSQI